MGGGMGGGDMNSAMMGPGGGYPMADMHAGGHMGHFPQQGHMAGGPMQGGMDMGPGMGMGGGGMGMGMPGMGMGMPGMGPGMQMGMGERVFPAVKLRGLPFDVTEDDVRMFLGCDPVDILMVHRDGRLSGEAFIVMSSPMHVELALSKNRSYMGRRYVEVFRSKRADYYKAVATEMTEGGGGGYGGGGYGGGGMGYGGGMAQGGGMGYGGYGGGGMGGGAPGGPASGYAAAAGPPGMGGDGAGTTILKLRGLPFQCSDEDIVRWFDDPSLGISPLTTDNVFIVQEHGRPSGIAFVELPTPQEATAAMGMNRKMMGSRYIEIFPANRADLEKYRARSGY
uniref:RRM domain-containing protein n=1 Tax=Chlamydomonas euryale TaxID=1486919 RepID=A0A7R9VIB2_9CHLO